MLIPASIVTWFVIFSWKRNTIPTDNLPLSIYSFIHGANPKGQELVKTPWIFQTWAQWWTPSFSYFSHSPGSAWLLAPGLCFLLLAGAQYSRLVAEVSFFSLTLGALRTQLVLDFLALGLPGSSGQLLCIPGALNFTLGPARPPSASRKWHSFLCFCEKRFRAW